MIDMRLQVLVSTMHQTDHSLLEKMNIRSDAIVINQCDRDEIERFTYRDHEILWMSLKERGVGLSRNTALMRATGDILLFADDDVVYDDDYVEKVLKVFEEHPRAGMIFINLQSMNPKRPVYITQRESKVHWYNCLRFGGCRIAVRREAVHKANVFFSLLFGGGAKYQSGEDSLFILQCLKRGIREYASEVMIGKVRQDESTWFKGYDEKYFFDKGVLMKQGFGIWAKPLLIPLIVKNRNQTKEVGLGKALGCAFRGADSI